MQFRALLYLSSFLLFTSCAPKQRTSNLTDLRSKKGVCTQANPSMVVSIRTCLQQGNPGTLNDHDRAQIVTYVFADGIDLANPGAYQLRLYRDGELILKKMMSKDVPNAPATADGRWKGVNVITPKNIKRWEPGVYDIKYVASYDTSDVASTKVTLQSTE